MPGEDPDRRPATVVGGPTPIRPVALCPGSHDGELRRQAADPGREAENAYWLLHENVPVVVNARKMRPADEVEVAAHRVLTGEPVLPEAIVNGPEQRFADDPKP